MKTESTRKNPGFAQCLLSLVIISLISQIPAGCSEKKKEKAAAPPKPVPMVYVTPVIKKNVPVYGEYVASIDTTTSADAVQIKARVEAVLTKQLFEEGRHVRKGEMLFLLDDSKYVADLKSAKASLEKANADLIHAKGMVDVESAKAQLESSKAKLDLAKIDVARLKPLAAQRAVPKQDYDNAVTNEKVAVADVNVKEAQYKTAVLDQSVSIKQAYAAIDSANAAIENAKINLDYCTIESPIDGIVGRRMVSPGNLVGRGEATLLTTVTSLDPIRINFNVSELDYIRMMKEYLSNKSSDKGADENNLELILSDGTVYYEKGKTIIIDPVLDPKTGTIGVVGEFRNPNRLLRPGMFGRIRVPIEMKIGAILAPQKSIVMLQSSRIAYIVGKDNIVRMRTVQIDGKSGKDFVIKSGLKENDMVIVDGIQKATPGIKVKPVEAKTATDRSSK